MQNGNIGDLADEVADLMGKRLKARGKGLAEKLRSCAKALPPNIRNQAEYLLHALEQSGAPKLAQQIDQLRVLNAYDECIAYLKQIGARDRAFGIALSMAASVALGILVTFMLLVGVLIWRGYL